MRAVFDTNVLIAAFLTEGLCAKLLLRANRGEFALISSPFILKELREKLAGKLRCPQDEVREAARLVSEIGLVVDPAAEGVVINGVCRDRDDDNVLAAAVASGADFIVTGDRDLLEIKRFKGVRILSPKEFEGVILKHGD